MDRVGELGRLGSEQGIGDYRRDRRQAGADRRLDHGFKSLAGPYVFCSLSTARPLLRLGPDQTVYLLAECRDPRRRRGRGRPTEAIQPTCRRSPATEFSFRSRMHWLTKTKAGIALGYAALLGLLVGAVVTSQTLYAATRRAARVRRAAGAGHPALADGGGGDAAVVLGRRHSDPVALPAVFGLAKIGRSAWRARACCHAG